MFSFISIALAGFSAGIIYFIILLRKKRAEMVGLPCPPIKNMLLGHLDIAGECAKLFPPDVHAHAWFPYIQKKYNMPDCFYMDWWPLGPRWLITTNPEVTSQFITTGYSLPKSPLAADFLNTFLGSNNLVGLEGQQWKHLRGMFNPGFSASHLMTLAPYIVDASLVFVDVLRAKARSNELFELEEYATKLTIDIIGKVVLDADFDSQKTPHPIVETFRKRVALMPTVTGPINLTRFEYIRWFRVWLNGRTLNKLVGEELDRKLAQRKAMEQAPKSFKDRKKSAVDLAVDAYVKEESEKSGHKDGMDLAMNQAFRQDAIDSMKTFIFAGHDTTASTIAYILYLLHTHPHAQRKVVQELQEVFSSNATPETIAEAIRSDPYIVNRLEYVTAVIKETLRLFPPASTLRYQPPASKPDQVMYITHPETGQKLPLSGWHVWAVVGGHGRNEVFFPEPAKFIPERFITSLTPFPEAKLFTPAGKDAWRPFEKGPRNCIGQELALIEMKIIVALCAPEFDFVAEYNGIKCETINAVETHIEYADGKPGKERRTVEGHRAYQVLKGAAKPKDGMPGRISFRKS